MTAWRVEGTLRDFPRFKPIDIWYQWPVHVIDDGGTLADVELNPKKKYNKKKGEKVKDSSGKNKEKRRAELAIAYNKCLIEDGFVRIGRLIEMYGKSEDSTKRHLNECSDIYVKDKDGYITLIEREGGQDK